MPATRPRRLPGLAVLAAAVVALVLAGCDYHDRYRRNTWSITVDNRTGITLDIYLDGGFRATLGHDTITTLPELFEDTYLLEALDGHGDLRARRTVYLDRDFVWVLE